MTKRNPPSSARRPRRKANRSLSPSAPANNRLLTMGLGVLLVNSSGSVLYRFLQEA